MSWLFKSNHPDPESSHLHRTVIQSSSPPATAHSAAVRHGVKDDISLIFRGVANFLAPPPTSSSSQSSSSAVDSSPSPALAGIRNDLVEIGGSFRSSANKAVTGISKFASHLLQFEPDQQRVDGDAVPGITEDVVRFVKEISTRPECWTEFPFPLPNDFSLSNSQREHALAIERLVPEFVTLRLNLCSYMNVEKFWMIYFLLILPRLNQPDFESLSTPKIVETRDAFLLKLGERKDLQAGECEKSRTVDTYQEGREDSGRESISFEENQILTEITNAAKGLEIDDSEKWLDDTDIDATSLTSCTKLQQEEDVSFSDLEDVGSYSSDKLSGHREAQDIRGSSPDGSSSDWVQLQESSERSGWQKAIRLKGKDSEDESNDWLTVDEFN
ncbi:BSD domain [Sesbania bispinosa]|nr:BSD domain [Sesbania bispinosa]